jgi:hypothetical protein
MKNIIIPTDFSKNATMAMDFAISNFNDPDASFWLTHVYRMPYSGAVVSVDLDDLLKKDREDEMRKGINRRTCKIPRFTNSRACNTRLVR